jgi:peptidyl-prolyl cis-trans isomerase C
MEKVCRRAVVTILLITLAFGFGLWSMNSWSQVKQDEVLAKIGDTVITNHDLTEMMSKFEAFRKGKPFEMDEKKQLLDSLVKSVLIAREAEKLKLDKDAAVQARMKISKIDILSKEYIISRVAPKIKVTDQEVDDYLKQYPDLIPRESLLLRAVLVNTEEEAKEIVKELKKGTNIGKLATERSIDASKRYAGRIGTFSKGSGKLPKSVEETIFRLKVGEFTNPVKLEKGWIIYYVEERLEKTQKEMDVLNKKVRVKIEQLVKGNKMEEILNKVVGEVSKDAKIEKFYDRIK